MASPAVVRSMVFLGLALGIGQAKLKGFTGQDVSSQWALGDPDVLSRNLFWGRQGWQLGTQRC